MRNPSWRTLALSSGLCLFGAGIALAVASTTFNRADCPGEIVCPQTGQLVCRDQCPMAAGDRPDCPGRSVCPLTGALVCVDRCPLKTDASQPARANPSCCRGSQKP